MTDTKGRVSFLEGLDIKFVDKFEKLKLKEQSRVPQISIKYKVVIWPQESSRSSCQRLGRLE
jgi:hypothetical protein